MSVQWRDKAFVKKRWNVDEDELVGIVLARILIPYWKRPDGVYMPLAYEISPAEEGCAYHRWMNVWYPCNPARSITEAEVRNELNAPDLWFRLLDIERAEDEGKVPAAGRQKDPSP